MSTAILCGDCEAANPVNSQFCLSCGAPLLPSGTASRPVRTLEPATGHDLYIFGETVVIPGHNQPFSNQPPVLASSPTDRRSITAVADKNVIRRLPPAPIIALAGIALVLVIAFSGLFVFGPLLIKSEARGANAATGNAPSSAEQVRDAIDAANKAQIKAVRQVDASLLNNKMTGQALSDNQQQIKQLGERRLYQIADMLDLQYQSVTFSDNNHATAHTIERWQSKVYRTGSAVIAQSSGPDKLAEVYTLVRQNGVWLVENIEIQVIEEATPPAN